MNRETVIGLLELMVVLCFVYLFRNEMVFRYRMKFRDRNLPCETPNQSYDRMFWDLRKWTYRQFFPRPWQ